MIYNYVMMAYREVVVFDIIQLANLIFMQQISCYLIIMSINSSDRRTWTEKQDQVLSLFVQDYIQNYDSLPKWAKVAEIINHKLCYNDYNHRTAKQCRQRWSNILKPGLKQRNTWNRQQSIKLMHLYKQKGHRWLKIAKQLQNRSENQVKNYFYSSVRKVIRKINIEIAKINAEIRKRMKQKKSASIIGKQQCNNRIGKGTGKFSVLKKDSQQILRQETIKTLEKMQMLDINTDRTISETQKDVKFIVSKTIKEQLFPEKPMNPISHDSVNKILLLAEQKQDCKLQIRKQIQTDYVLRTRDQFVFYIQRMIESQNGEIQDQQQQKSDLPNQIYGKQIEQKGSQAFPGLLQFIKDLNDIAKSCKKKSYRDHKLSHLSRKQQEEILKDKKRNEHKIEKIIKQKIKQQGLNIIPNKLQRQQLIHKYEIDKIPVKPRIKSKSNLEINQSGIFKSQLADSSYFDSNIIQEKLKRVNNNDKVVNQQPIKCFSKLYSNQAESARVSDTKKKVINKSFTKRKNSKSDSDKDQEFLISSNKSRQVKKRKSISKQNKDRTLSFQTSGLKPLKIEQPIFSYQNKPNFYNNIDIQASNPFYPFENYNPHVINSLNMSQKMQDQIYMNQKYRNSKQKIEIAKGYEKPIQYTKKTNNFFSAIPTFKVNQKTHNYISPQQQELLNQSPLVFQLQKKNSEASGCGLLRSSGIIDYDRKRTDQKLLNFSEQMLNQSNNFIKNSNSFRPINSQQKKKIQNQAQFNGMKLRNMQINLPQSERKKQCLQFPCSPRYQQFHMDMSRSFNLYNFIPNISSSPRFYQRGSQVNVFNTEFNPLAGFSLGQNTAQAQKGDDKSKKQSSNSEKQLKSQRSNFQVYDSCNLQGLQSSGNYQNKNHGHTFNPMGINLGNSMPLNFLESMNYQQNCFQRQLMKSLNQSMLLNSQINPCQKKQGNSGHKQKSG